MMLDFKFSGDTPRMVRYASEHLAAWVLYGLGDASHEFIPFVQYEYLRGQVLNRITGETSDSVQAWHPRKWKNGEQTYFIRPGVGIDGNLNYLYRWIGTEYEFMRPAWEHFTAIRSVGDYISRNIDKMLEKGRNSGN